MVTLRPADMSDEERLLEWRNEPTTRAASLTTAKVSADDHNRWLTRKLTDPGTALFIVLDEGEPIGQVRLDRLNDRLAEVSIGLAPEARGRGAGRQALALAAAEAGRRLGVRELSAQVKPDNEASLRSFTAAGYAEHRRSEEVVELRLELGQETSTR